MNGRRLPEIAAGALVCLPGAARADGGVDVPSLAETGLRAGLALLAVLALIGILGVLLRRLRFRSPLGARGRLTSVARLDLGGRREIRLVRADGRLLAIGVTPERVELLTELPPEVAPGADADAKTAPGTVRLLRSLTTSS